MCNLLTFLLETQTQRHTSLSLNGGNKLGELELLAADQLLSKLILRMKGLFSFLLALHSASVGFSGTSVRVKYGRSRKNHYKRKV